MSAWANEIGTMKVEFIKEPNVIHTVIKNNAQEFVIYSNNDKYEY